MNNYLTIDEQAVLSAKKFLRSEAELLENIQRVDKARVWEKFAYTSLFIYCVKRLKLSESTTSAFISVARKSISVPELKAAVEEGTLTLSQAKRVVSVIEPANATMWIEKASTLKQRELDREVAATLPSPDLKEKLKAVGGEMSELRLILPEAMRKKLERQVEIRGCSMLAAFDFAMEETLKRHDPLRRAERNLRKKETKQENTHSSEARSSRNGTPQSARIDGRIAGRPAVAARVQHEVVTRDEARCTFLLPDGTRCENRRWLHTHHVTHRSQGGLDTVPNLTLVCSWHHRHLHRLEMLAPARK